MLIEVDPKTYSEFFRVDPHPFISEKFIELNRKKTEKIVRLIEKNADKPAIGFAAGIKNRVLQSPFSAPFGGFHFRNQNIYISQIDSFINSLKEYITSQEISGIELTLPPDIYHPSFNAKTINSLMRNGFTPNIPDITNWVDLLEFKGRFNQKNSREYYSQAVRNGLHFDLASDEREEKDIYELICNNRAKFGRPIYMTFNDVKEIDNLWPVDFFKVNTEDGVLAASAIFYRSHPETGFAVFWGDSDEGRPLRAMDFLAFNLWSYYKKLGFKYLDMGISTESGLPNEGLLRFKEAHDTVSSLRYKFTWKA